MPTSWSVIDDTFATVTIPGSYSSLVGSNSSNILICDQLLIDNGYYIAGYGGGDRLKISTYFEIEQGSFIDLGAGNDQILYDGATGGGWSMSITGGKINMGTGSDLISILNTGSGANGMELYADRQGSAFLDLGKGNDKIIIDVDNQALKLENAGVLQTGDGDDLIDLTSRSSQRALEVLFSELQTGRGRDVINAVSPRGIEFTRGSLVGMGEGNDRLISRAISIPSPVTDSLALEIRDGAMLDMGFGSDVVDVRAENGDSALRLRDSGSLKLGVGNDQLYVSNGLAPTSKYALAFERAGLLDLGSGKGFNSFVVADSYLGFKSDNGSIYLGSKSNTFQVTTKSNALDLRKTTIYADRKGRSTFSVVSETGQALKLEESSLSLGSGNDVASFMGATKSLIKLGNFNLGDGADTAKFATSVGSTAAALEIEAVSLETGAGNDRVEILAQSGADYALELDNSGGISTGDGDDSVLIQGDIFSWGPTTNIMLGSGNDVLDMDWLYDRVDVVDDVIINGGLGGDRLLLEAGSYSVSISPSDPERIVLGGTGGTTQLSVFGMEEFGSKGLAASSLSDGSTLTFLSNGSALVA